MIVIELRRPIRFFSLRLKIRRRLPQSWNELAQGRRLLVFRALLRQGEEEALRIALRLGRRTWAMLGEADKGAIISACAKWLNLEPNPVPIIQSFNPPILESFPSSPNKYLLAAPNFVNGSCMEFALADEYLGDVMAGKETSLKYLTATLLREIDPDTATAMKREDLRVTLHGRMEVEERAKRQQRIPHEVRLAVLIYFIGVKKLIHRLYGEWLFAQPQEPVPGAEPAPVQGDPLGWWGMYMDAAGGDVQKLDAIQQSNFHNFCTMEVRRRKQQKEAEMRSRMAAPDFGQP